jgi:hypothetical protein
MGVICKKNLSIHPIQELLSDKQCVFRIQNREEKTGIIAAGYHVVNKTQASKVKSQKQFLDFSTLLLKQYSDSIIVIYIDANQNLYETEFGQQILDKAWQILSANKPTRRGYFGQRDTQIDFFIFHSPPRLHMTTLP